MDLQLTLKIPSPSPAASRYGIIPKPENVYSVSRFKYKNSLTFLALAMIIECARREPRRMGGLAERMELANRCCRPGNQIVR